MGGAQKGGSEMSLKMAIKATTVAAALAAMMSFAWAEPTPMVQKSGSSSSIKLTDVQMDQVSAGMAIGSVMLTAMYFWN